MKTNFIKIGFMLLIVLFVMGCRNNDQPEPTETCPNTDILGLAFTGAPSPTNNPLFGYLDNSTAISTLTPIANIPIANPSLPAYLFIGGTNNAVYNPASNDYKLVIPEEQRLITLSSGGALTNTPIVTGLPSPDITNAPVYLNSNLYYGHISNVSGGLSFSVLDNAFNIVSTVTIPTANISGTYLFNFTSATDGINKLYFVVANNLVIYNTALNTISATMINGAPFVSGSIIGLEFKETNILYALYEDWDISSVPTSFTNNTKLVEIDATNPVAITTNFIIDLGFDVNPEFFSTTYNECNQKYYLSTGNLGSGSVARTLRIDLVGTPAIVALPASYFWISGLTLKR